MSEPTAFQCDRCGAILGNCHGRQLVVGATVFETRPVTLRCYKCAAAKTWYPPKPEIAIDSTKSIS